MVKASWSYNTKLHAITPFQDFQKREVFENI